MSNSIFDFTSQVVSVQDVARNYSRLFAKVNRDKKPLVVFNRSKPTVAIVDMETFNKFAGAHFLQANKIEKKKKGMGRKASGEGNPSI